MDGKQILGRYIKGLRESKGLSQNALAEKTGISYQYLSGLENGRENFTIEVLEALAKALGTDLLALVTKAYQGDEVAAAPKVKAESFRKGVPLPTGLTVENLTAALDATTALMARINNNLVQSGGKPLPAYIQGNNFSGIISNMLSDALNDHTPYKHNSAQAYPDLINKEAKGGQVGLEVKATIQIGKGGESHNGHSGWHLIACFDLNKDTGIVKFLHVMLAVLNSHTDAEPDWTYVGSKVNKDTGSRRTETYNTTLIGTTKLRDGSIYLDEAAIDYARWRYEHRGAIPTHSIFASKLATVKKAKKKLK